MKLETLPTVCLIRKEIHHWEFGEWFLDLFRYDLWFSRYWSDWWSESSRGWSCHRSTRSPLSCPRLHGWKWWLVEMESIQDSVRWVTELYHSQCTVPNLKTRRGGLNTSWHRSIPSGRRSSKCDICTIMCHWLWILSDLHSFPRARVALEGPRVRENDTRVDYVWWKTYFDYVVHVDKETIIRWSRRRPTRQWEICQNSDCVYVSEMFGLEYIRCLQEPQDHTTNSPLYNVITKPTCIPMIRRYNQKCEVGEKHRSSPTCTIGLLVSLASITVHTIIEQNQGGSVNEYTPGTGFLYKSENYTFYLGCRHFGQRSLYL